MHCNQTKYLTEEQHTTHIQIHTQTHTLTHIHAYFFNTTVNVHSLNGCILPYATAFQNKIKTPECRNHANIVHVPFKSIQIILRPVIAFVSANVHSLYGYKVYGRAKVIT